MLWLQKLLLLSLYGWIIVVAAQNQLINKLLRNYLGTPRKFYNTYERERKKKPGEILPFWRSKMKSVAVIGAGGAGLAMARYLCANQKLFKCIVYEQGSQVGGTWIYGDEKWPDKKLTGREIIKEMTENDKIHSSMYKSLRYWFDPTEIKFEKLRKCQSEKCICVVQAYPQQNIEYVCSSSRHQALF